MPSPSRAAGYRAWGIAFALAGVIGFSFRPILIKLAYAAFPVAPVTLLFLRMAIALPFFAAMAWWLRARRTAAHATRLGGHGGARLHRLLPGKLSRFHRPAVGRRRARAADPVPLPHAGAAAVAGFPEEAPEQAPARGPGPELRRHRAGGVEPLRRACRKRAVPARREPGVRREPVLRDLPRGGQPDGAAGRLDALYRLHHDRRHAARGGAVLRARADVGARAARRGLVVCRS